jgi:fumarate hydratase class II
MRVEQELWGAETRKAVDNFPVSGEPIPIHVARWLGRIKAAAARVNAELGLLDGAKAERIAAAGGPRVAPRPPTASRPASSTTSSRSTSSRRARALRRT